MQEFTELLAWLTAICAFYFTLAVVADLLGRTR
jgi:hypothetical protein